eukprot:m.221280 g.221280  ORF g.221280 m.221280 type:complete len:184 (+) comp15756_c0_seq1:47-598(+)
MAQDKQPEPVAAAPPKEEKEESSEEESGDEGQTQEGSKHSRSELKARKALLKLGLKQVPGINRVAIKKSKTILFVIPQPEVFQSPGTDTFIIFGEARVEDLGAQAQAQAAEQFKAKEGAVAPSSTVPSLAAVAEEENVDSTGVEEKDIELVIQQTGVPRGKAVTMLKKHKGDIVNAIMELTTM